MSKSSSESGSETPIQVPQSFKNEVSALNMNESLKKEGVTPGKRHWWQIGLQRAQSDSGKK